MVEPRARRASPLSEAGRRLSESGVSALVVSEPPDLPCADVLVARGQAPAAERELERLAWRWRIGGDGAWRLAGRRRYVFDGGFVLTVHRALPVGPLPAGALRSLDQALWSESRPGEDGLRRCRHEPLLAYLGVQAARGALRSHAQLAEATAHARLVTDWDEVWLLARKAGVHRTLAALLGDVGAPDEAAASAPAKARVRSAAWCAAGALRTTRRAPWVRDALLGEPWRHAATRCRFCDLELLAGPGTFLPRGVSEQLVSSSVDLLAEVDGAMVVDVGTGCGAVALALARRLNAQVLGVDSDAQALTWARRNARRLGLPGVEFVAGSLLDQLPAEWRGRVDLVAANVPCLPPGSFEGALDAGAPAYVGAGSDGLGLQRQLAEQARDALRPGGWLLVQLAPDQWHTYEQTLQGLGYRTAPARGDAVAVVGGGQLPARS